MLLSIIYVVIGLVFLIWGGEWLVRGATRLATHFQISPVVIGLTVVAFGTSAPELGVSIQAAWSGAVDVAVGNVVGSNLVNTLLILGIAALIKPLSVAEKLIRVDTPLMVGASLAAYALAFDGQINRLEGAILFTSLLLYLGFRLHTERRESKSAAKTVSEQEGHEPEPNASVLAMVVLMVTGLTLLGVGARLLVHGAVAIAQYAGVSDVVIGLTIVSIGTSLPEVVTSVVASYRGEKGVAVGNVVGSNMFNLLGVLGLTAVLSPVSIPIEQSTLNYDLPFMVIVAMVCVPIFWSGRKVFRWEGGAMLASYLIYITLLLIRATAG